MADFSSGGGGGTPPVGLRDALDASPDVFYVTAPDGSLVRWNDALASVAGLEDADLEGRRVDDLLAGEAAAAVVTAVRDGRPVLADGSVVTSAGERVPYEFAAAPLPTEGDDPPIVGIGRELEGRTRGGRRSTSDVDLERLYAASNRLYAAHSTDACLEVAIDAAVEILGFDWCTLAAPAPDGEDFEIRAISEGAPLEEGARPFRVDEGIAGRVYETGESRVTDDVRTSGASKPVSDDIRAAVTVPVGDWGVFQAVARGPAAFDDRDRQLAELLLAAVASAVERIEREEQLRERQAELERQNDRLERFADVVSHDLRSPLNVLRGSLQRAEETGDADAFDHCYDAVRRMDRLVEDLLALASEGSVIDEPTPVDLAAIARRRWHTVDTADAGLRVDGEATVRADESRLGQLLENLFRNAIEHGGADVTVTVSPLESGFAVEDDGPGIPAAERDRVFEAGYTSTDEGTGLGLNIVAEIAEAHDWTVSATDGADGGARFEICGVDRLDYSSH